MVVAARGQASIREFFVKDIAASASAGVATNGGPTTDVGISGDLGWEWGTFTVTNKSGATVDKGKYVTVYTKKDGKWLIIRDIWNSDGAM
jgi:ketosteroid isomerase-like protein